MKHSSYEIVENDSLKILKSDVINYIFNKVNGVSAVWGKTKDDDPEWCPFGPLIADIEITTKCFGASGKLCKFCYKSNTPYGKNMSFDHFKEIFKRLPDTLQQIAFGVDANCTANPDTFRIMSHCRENGVIPNVTVADITDDTADKLASLCGAVAVSRYDDKDICYDSVKRLTDRGMDQVNIHIMISEETYMQVLETLYDLMSHRDPRLEKLNAIVFLSLKQKGRGSGFTRLSTDKFNHIVKVCLKHNIPFGFDSCSAVKFLDSVKDHELYGQLKMVSEPCESSLFSIYIDVNGYVHPCSFCEGSSYWGDEGIKVLDYDKMIDIWMFNDRFSDWRHNLLKNNRNCFEYDI